MAHVRFALSPPKVGGKVSLGPVPGTPEFAFEQNCKAAGVAYVPPDHPDRAAAEAAVDGPITQSSRG